MMFYLWPFPDQDDFPSRNVQSNQSKTPRTLCFLNCPPKAEKSQRKQARGHQLIVSMCQDATHKFCTNILPRNQDGRSPPKKAARSPFSLATSTHLDTPEQVQIGDAEAQVSAAGRGPEDRRRGTSQNHPRGTPGPMQPKLRRATSRVPLPAVPHLQHTHSPLTTVPSPHSPLCPSATVGSNAHFGERGLSCGDKPGVQLTSIHRPKGADPDRRSLLL